MIKYSNIFYVMGCLLFIFAGLMVIPASVDFILQSETSSCFTTAAIFSCFIGGLLFFSNTRKETLILSYNDKIVITILSWIVLPIVAATPLMLSAFPISAINSIFEATSALTTTGSTIIYDIRSFSEGFMLWNGLLQLIGSIGFIISCVCVFDNVKSNYKFAYLFETIGQSEIESITSNAKFLLSIYVPLTLIGAFFLSGAGMPAIEAICCCLSAISSGGLLPSGNYNFLEAPSYLNWVLSFLMFVSGCSIIFLKKLTNNWYLAIRDIQFRWYCLIVFGSMIFVTTAIYIANTDLSFFSAVENACFVSLSSITTTDFSIQNFPICNNIINTMLLVLTFLGGCAGSATGGIKIFRLIITFLIVKNFLLRIVRINAVHIPTYDGNRLDEFDVTNIFSFFACYICLAVILIFLFSYQGVSLSSAIGTIFTAMNNSSILLNASKATAMQLCAMTDVSKLILITSMIAGRMEFVLLFVLFVKPFSKK